MTEIKRSFGLVALYFVVCLIFFSLLPKGTPNWVVIGGIVVFGVLGWAADCHQQDLREKKEEAIAMAMHETEVRLRIEAEQKQKQS